MTYLVDNTQRGVGDVATGDVAKDPVARLIAEVNRFGPSAPETYRYVTTPYPLATGNVPPAVAVTAAQIFWRRVQDALVKDPSAASLVPHAKQALANPGAYVSANLPEVTAMVKSYGDFVGLPPAQGTTSVFGFPINTVAIVVAIGAAMFVLLPKTRKKGRR